MMYHERGMTLDFTAMWEYQKLDMQVEKIESALKKGTSRQAVSKLRNFLNDQKQYLTSCEEDIAQKSKQCDDLLATADRLSKKASALSSKLSQDTPIADVQDRADELNALYREISEVETKLSTFTSQMQEQSTKLADLRKRTPKAVKELEEAKAAYEADVAKVAPELTSLKVKRDALISSIPEELYTKYQSVRLHRMPPLAKLLGNQCGGCNMELAGAAVRLIKNGEKLVECENCGRILTA